MLTERELIKFLYDTGHFWNVSNPNGLNVGLADLSVLTLADKVTQDAVASWQASDANFSVLAGIVHRRDVNADGDVGPVTQFMVEVPRCAMPDHSPPDNAQFKYDDPFLQGAVESMQRFNLASQSDKEAAVGSGSFPVPGCDPTRKNRATEHSTVLNLDLSKTPSKTLSEMDEILLFLRKCMAEKGLAVRCVKNGGSAPTHFLEWAYLLGSTIGINYFPTPGTCNQVVNGRIDIGFQDRPIIMAGLLVHEAKGHGIGLNHTRGGIMNSSINLVDPLSWIGDPAESTLNRYFGGAAVPLDDDVPSPPPPPPPPGTEPEFIGELTGDHNAAGQIAIRGVIDVVVKEGQKPGRFPQILVPSDTPGKFHFEPKS